MSRWMPPEWAPHAATWMAFPAAAYPTAGVSDADVWQAWADVANLIVDHEPVHMLCNRDQMAHAQRLLSSQVVLHEAEYNDAWLRDTGPTFGTHSGKLEAVDWRFNGWGDNTSFDWQPDAQLARRIADIINVEVISSPLTNEGGGIHTDGGQRVLLTTTVQLDADRNRDWSREQVEDEVHRQLGTEQAIWLPDGLWRDYADHGTRGHVDMVACFNAAGTVLVHQQQSQDHPDCQRYPEHCRALESAGLRAMAIPAPTTLRDASGWVDYSYINHYVANGAVIQPAFSDPGDGLARELLSEAWPDREIRMVDARVIFAMGGGVHCITQQQPRI